MASEFSLLVPLTQNQWALIDPEDAEKVFAHKWHAKVTKRGVVYAGTNVRTGGKYRWVSMHQFLAEPAKGLEVDHRDGDGRNNTRENLRVCLHQQNMANRRAYGVSKYLGVSRRANGKWDANCKGRHLGTFASEISAARAYDDEARIVHGCFARLNFVGDDNV